VGLALTTSSFALASLFARNMLAKVATKSPVSHRLYHAPALLGVTFIAFLGAVLYFSPLIK
jgi:ABC-type nickel/cobalt efflux system permease component RcnA